MRIELAKELRAINGSLTKVRQALLDHLADGMMHGIDDLLRVLNENGYDDLNGVETLRVHMTYLRRSIRDRGLGIASIQLEGRSYYQLVRLIRSGRRE